jgi:hypothetical protein
MKRKNTKKTSGRQKVCFIAFTAEVVSVIVACCADAITSTHSVAVAIAIMSAIVLLFTVRA